MYTIYTVRHHRTIEMPGCLESGWKSYRRTETQEFENIKATSPEDAKRMVMRFYFSDVAATDTAYNVLLRQMTVEDTDAKIKPQEVPSDAQALLAPLLVLAPHQVAARSLVPVAIDQLQAVDQLLRLVNGAFDDSKANPNTEIPENFRDHMPLEVNTAIGHLRDAQSLLSTFLKRVSLT